MATFSLHTVPVTTPRSFSGMEQDIPGLSTSISLDPDHTPIPAKLLGEILEGKFIDLAELISENLECPTTQPTFSIILETKQNGMDTLHLHVI